MPIAPHGEKSELFARSILDDLHRFVVPAVGAL
jgi:hypothetical protein